MMLVAECLFCRIVSGDVPSAILRSDESTVAFMTIQPATEGHVLVVPRRHARNLFDVEARDLQAVARAAQEIALWQRERLGCAGVSLFQANEPAGFQSVFHYHVHVVPRYRGDIVSPAWADVPHASLDHLQQVATKLRGGPIATTAIGGGQLTHALGAATVIVDEADRVLLVRHSYGPLNWEIPGGISEAGESAEGTARREVREEIGIEIAVEALTGVYWEPEWRGTGGHHFVFRARLPNGAVPRVADPKEIADLGWFAFADLPRPINDFTALRIRHALDGTPPLVHTIGPRKWLE